MKIKLIKYLFIVSYASKIVLANKLYFKYIDALTRSHILVIKVLARSKLSFSIKNINFTTFVFIYYLNIKIYAIQVSNLIENAIASKNNVLSCFEEWLSLFLEYRETDADFQHISLQINIS